MRDVLARSGRALLAAIVIATLLPGAAGAQGGGQGDAPEQVLDRQANGEAAITALGDRLPEVAARYGHTPGELRALFRGDDTLWIDTTAALYYREPVAVEQGPPGTGALDGPYELTTAATFGLHSKPGSQRTIYLDFDGHRIEGTAWNSGADAGGYDAEPFSIDGDPAFSEAELATIQSVWQRVAEDYAPFDVDVTTQAPTDLEVINRSGSGDHVFGTRVLITSTTHTECTCGGVAYVGVFDHTTNHSYYQPALVYTEGVGTGAHNIAEATSHEAGHNLGLSHDGTRQTGYYEGHGAWAPIMGVGYYRPITQWSRGEYGGANNREDDYAVMAGNGAAVRADDRPSTTTFTALPAAASGIIERPTDTDAFSFTTAEPGLLDVVVSPGSVSPDLDIRAVLTGSDGTVLADVDPASTGERLDDVATGMGATIQVTVAAGSYTLTVDGVGAGDPSSTGYSDYGSLGHYGVSVAFTPDGTVEPPPPPPPPPPPADELTAPTTVSATLDGTTVTVTWSGAAGHASSTLVRETKGRGNRWTQHTVAAGIDPTTTTATDAVVPAGTHRYVVIVVGANGSTASSAPSTEVTVSDGSTGGGGNGNGGGKKNLVS